MQSIVLLLLCSICGKTFTRLCCFSISSKRLLKHLLKLWVSSGAGVVRCLTEESGIAFGESEIFAIEEYPAALQPAYAHDGVFTEVIGEVTCGWLSDGAIPPVSAGSEKADVVYNGLVSWCGFGWGCRERRAIEELFLENCKGDENEWWGMKDLALLDVVHGVRDLHCVQRIASG